MAKLDGISRKIVQSILSESLDKLAILRHINGWSTTDQTVVEYRTVEEQATAIKNDDVLPADSKDSVDLRDFQRDCSFIESTIQKTYEEILQGGSYNCLSKVTDIFRKLQSEEADLLRTTKAREQEYVELQDLFYEERLVFKGQTAEIMAKIGNLKDEIEDFRQEAASKSAYLASWQNSQLETAGYELSKKTELLVESIEDKRLELCKETRVHLETRTIFNEIEMDLQKQLKNWRIKYENDLQAIGNKIAHLQEAKDQQQEKTAQMIMKYIKRQEEIDCYQAHKVEQQKQRLEKDRKDRAATKIQAWWRGTMVRKGFGKYKKKEKRGKKKKK
ncbi:dynein regulatory complex protein 9 [Dendroctonus ponderosae]|uniref:Dynein regulatory complex protein 9 n=1 Tax=Dendroctonus ponderosae TaxID=77166 RepID=A0AAR5P2Q1_DENPD|nr:dynein regulatory complex protein 9 [Dendroctonus ponderosae]KAH1001797.1 hypothetical protein HUJ04_005764 [Dendroctonus ponderosae]KAH1004762.1 hypothetical protein HUJ05_005540 [Dendroctonus ponderosae]